ncbi:MAG: hypothetical protein IJ733_14635 [Lachnospiraceae bacterium]|nr:hypothetical protein [Lachnospiraceae bacterium]
MKNDFHHYDDMLYLPHHEPDTRPRMPLLKRAAQFAPFAALSGYEEAIAEAARLTAKKPELSEDARSILDYRLLEITEQFPAAPAVKITYYVPDKKKEGGTLSTLFGKIKQLDKVHRKIRMENQIEIPIDDILEISPDKTDTDGE